MEETTSIYETMDLSTINPNLDLTPTGDYLFEFQGAYPNKYKAGSIDIKAVVVGGGDGAAIGRTEYIRYNMENSNHQQQLVRLVKSMGLEFEPGNPLPQLIAFAKLRPRFEATVTASSYPDKTTGELVQSHKVALKSVREATQAHSA